MLISIMLSSLVIDRIMLAFHNHGEERDRGPEQTTSIIVLAILTISQWSTHFWSLEVTPKSTTIPLRPPICNLIANSKR